MSTLRSFMVTWVMSFLTQTMHGDFSSHPSQAFGYFDLADALVIHLRNFNPTVPQNLGWLHDRNSYCLHP